VTLFFKNFAMNVPLQINFRKHGTEQETVHIKQIIFQSFPFIGGNSTWIFPLYSQDWRNFPIKVGFHLTHFPF
jgi:hypothetical protein